MRAYLPISYDELATFLNSGNKNLESILAPTPFYVGENDDLDEEEIEYLLSLEAAQDALELRGSNKAPGIVLAIELEATQVNQVNEKSVTLNSDVTWDQVQCALLLFPDDEELIWFATQEIALNLGEWK
ncbi:MAG: hypothetical protein F2690_00505 [Actinobacteria bacterium]|uniref:Unannotated protein n=1 Tax=freshwater metagenome TaxID=449393 RepID=A0A6J5YNA7_9ZZZZ|nr:hypothetical protein [Actinomycetota bacterium]MSX71536.1 hypothetical protein [Actinomycetota bacterium]MSY69040.1 hypothetical protein [Actinomycetota bacterium]MTA75481.1 hypothetical protein [Actinomycetota bacterium]